MDLQTKIEVICVVLATALFLDLWLTSLIKAKVERQLGDTLRDTLPKDEEDEGYAALASAAPVYEQESGE